MKQLSRRSSIFALAFLAFAAIAMYHPLDAGVAATAGPSSAPVFGQPTSGQGTPGNGVLIDLALSSSPVPSVEVFRERLQALGVTEQEADAALARLAVAAVAPLEEGADVSSVIAQMGLPPAEEGRALDWANALVAGRPVALEGVSVEDREAALIDTLVGQGVDPDEAAWLVLQGRSAGWPSDDVGAGRMEAFTRLVAESSGVSEERLRAAVVEAVRGRTAGGSASGVGLGTGRARLETTPGEGEQALVPLIGTCKTCPQFDFALTPSTIYQTHASTVDGGCRIYRFTVQASKTYRFTFCDGGGTASFDTILDAFGTTCNALASNDDSCTTRSQLDVTTGAAGYIYLKVSSKLGTAGSYTLAYKDLGIAPSGCVSCPAFDHGTFTPTTVYQTHASSIGPGGCRIYKFQLSANHSYRFTFCEGGGATSFPSTLQALTASCTLGPSDSGACGLGSQLDVGAQATGFMYVKVTSPSGGSGSYTLAYRDITADCPACPIFNFGPFRPKRLPAQTHASIVAGTGCRMYAFDLGAGVRYHFSLCANGGSAGFPAILTLGASNCAQVASDTTSCNGSDPQVNFTPLTTGRYYLRVGPRVGSGGSYTLAYWSDCAWCDESTFGPFTPSCLVTSHPGSLASGCTQVYAFNVVGGATYDFSTCNLNTTFDSKLTVLNASCLVLGSASGGCGGFPNGADALVTIPGTGATTAYVVVQGQTNTESGAYQLDYSTSGSADSDMDGTPDCVDGCASDPSKTAPGACGCGVPDTDNDMDGTANCNDGCPNDGNKTAPGACGCGTPDTNSDMDGLPDCLDGCPNDANKTVPGDCGCGVAETPDTDMDGSFDCNDLCPNDANKTAPGQCGCGIPDSGDSDMDGAFDCSDGCPNDANKTAAGQCGCGIPDTDSDMDGTANCNDGCPNDANKTAPGQCGCGVLDTDTDMDGTANCNDGCPNDANKTAPGNCSCGVAETPDTDMDGTFDCNDGCPNDANKTAAGNCGCGVAETPDTDMDGAFDCNDGCPNDGNKTAAGNCGCGVAETPDTDMDGSFDCNDGCPNDANKTAPGNCGCGVAETPDTDMDGAFDCNDLCPNDVNKTVPGNCGCGVAETPDTDMDGTFDCNDGCPNDVNKTAPGNCGCGVAETPDTDMDGTFDCNDGCPNDANKTAAGNCGCGVAETPDTDMDGTFDCNDGCPNDANKTAAGQCGCGNPDTDTDMDGTADCNDNCPNDPNKTTPGACGCGVSDADTDMDGTLDCFDGCPADASKTEPLLCGCGSVDTGAVEKLKIISPSNTNTDNFGPPSVDGDTAVFGNPREDFNPGGGTRTDAGRVYVYIRNTGTNTWAIQGGAIQAPTVVNNALFGSAVAVVGDTLAVAAPGEDKVYVYTRSAGVWTNQATISKPADGFASTNWGDSIALDVKTASDKTILVGDPLNTVSGAARGAVYVERWNGATWAQEGARLFASDGVASDELGFSVAISVDTAVVGSRAADLPSKTDAGAAYVFTRSVTTWTQQQKLTASDGAASDKFGTKVDVNGTTAIAGAPLADLPSKADAGAAYVFTLSMGTWTEQAKLTASDALTNDNFGDGAALSGNAAAVGARGATGAGKTGAAYVYVRSVAGTWTQVKKVTASDAAANDDYGWLDLSGDALVVGAPLADRTSPARTNLGKGYIYDLCP